MTTKIEDANVEEQTTVENVPETESVSDENPIDVEQTDTEMTESAEETSEEPAETQTVDEQGSGDAQREGILSDYADKKARKKEKKKLTPEQKKKRAIKALIITASIVLVLGIFISSCAIANAVGSKALIKQAMSFNPVEYAEGTQLVPQKDTDGYWTFTADRDLKVLQFTDVHIGGGCFSKSKDTWAMNAVATMIKQEKPDLVVVTGDIAYPVPFQAGTFNNIVGAQVFANMMESLKVYWTFAFGNHDTEAYSMYTREEICEYYEEQNFQYCLFDRGYSSEDLGYGNSIIKVKNSSGITTQALVMLDSHSYIDGDYFGAAWKYDIIHKEQSDWYAAQMDKLVQDNKAIDPNSSDVVKNLAFFHIPLVQYRDAWKQYRENDNHDTADVKYHYGTVGEDESSNKNGVDTYGIFSGLHSENETFFDTGVTHGLQGTFCGHDHYNNFSLDYKGIRLTYGMSIDYLAYPGIYKEHSQRGCTVITVKADGSFDCQAKNYYTYKDVKHEKG